MRVVSLGPTGTGVATPCGTTFLSAGTGAGTDLAATLGATAAGAAGADGSCRVTLLCSAPGDTQPESVPA